MYNCSKKITNRYINSHNMGFGVYTELLVVVGPQIPKSVEKGVKRAEMEHLFEMLTLF